MSMIHKELRQARQKRRLVELERHLKAAFQIAGQAHLQATSNSSPEMVLALIKRAQDELESTEAALWKGVKVKA